MAPIVFFKKSRRSICRSGSWTTMMRGDSQSRHRKGGGNGGFFIWSSPMAAKGVPFLRAIEVQVLDNGYGNTASHTTHGDVFPIHGATMVPFGKHSGMRSFPSESRSKSAPEWNHYLIEG